jgi:hypothetical protein
MAKQSVGVFYSNQGSKSRAFLEWVPVTADEKEDKAFEERIKDYLDFCEEQAIMPTIEGFCSACGITKEEYDYWNKGITKVSDRRKAALRRIDTYFLAVYTEALNNGSINFATGIFTLKNNFGYKDEQHITASAPSLLSKAKTNAEYEALLKANTGGELKP